MVVKVSTGNLVRPWSWVIWQVHVGICLSRKPLSKASRVNERSWAGRDTEVKQRDKAYCQNKGNCLKGLYVFDGISPCWQSFTSYDIYTDTVGLCLENKSKTT